MASQRITIAKVGGQAADLILTRLREWSSHRVTTDPSEWSSDQWPLSVRIQVDSLADRIRTHALQPPVIYFVEWSDLWSMGDLFGRWLKSPIRIFGDRFEIYGYSLPDDGQLARILKDAGPQQFPEYDYFVGRLREAVAAWDAMDVPAIIVVLREVVGGLVTDEEVEASMSLVPDWITEI